MTTKETAGHARASGLNYGLVSAAGTNGCESPKTPFDLIILPLPQINYIGSNYVPIGGTTTLSVDSYDSYLWKNSLSATVGNQQTLVVASPDVYNVAVTKSGAVANAQIIVGDNLGNLNLNYVVESEILVPNITSASQISQLVIGNRQQKTHYFDGLGRPIQSVVTQASPMKNDFVTSNIYDAVGRENKKYLPVITDNTGRNKSNLFDAGGNYTVNTYSNPSDKIADDIKPLAETIFEPSPLNRVIKQGAPGVTWQPVNPGGDIYSMNDNTVKKRYETNQASEVFLFTYASTTGLVTVSTDLSMRFYAANQLFANKTYDEHARDNTTNEVIEYTDKLGRVVCKKVYVKTVNSVKQYASTYYVYDDIGNLVVVLPPEGVNSLISQY